MFTLLVEKLQGVLVFVFKRCKLRAIGVGFSRKVP